MTWSVRDLVGTTFGHLQRIAEITKWAKAGEISDEQIGEIYKLATEPEESREQRIARVAFSGETRLERAIQDAHHPASEPQQTNRSDAGCMPKRRSTEWAAC